MNYQVKKTALQISALKWFAVSLYRLTILSKKQCIRIRDEANYTQGNILDFWGM